MKRRFEVESDGAGCWDVLDQKRYVYEARGLADFEGACLIARLLNGRERDKAALKLLRAEARTVTHAGICQCVRCFSLSPGKFRP